MQVDFDLNSSIFSKQSDKIILWFNAEALTKSVNASAMLNLPDFLPT